MAWQIYLKILLGSSLYAPNAIGGAEKVVQVLATDLSKSGHQVVVLTSQPSGEPARRMIDGVLVYYVPVRNVYRPFTNSEHWPFAKVIWRTVDSFNALMLPAYQAIIDHEKPDVMNTHNIAGLSVSIWSAAKRQGIPIVHTLHDQYLLCHRSTMFKQEKNCLHRCIDCRALAISRRFVSRHVDAVVGVSDFILRRHRKFSFFASAIRKVIYNTRVSVPPLLAEHSVANHSLRFGFLGQIIPTKGLHRLLSAFLATARTSDAKLFIGGKVESKYAMELKHRTVADDRVCWLGVVKPEEFFREIDVLVVPSIWHDTAPLVILEAYGHGVPVLGSTRGGIPELIGPGTGWLYDPDAPDALEQALVECISSEAKMQSMRLNCLARAQDLGSRKWSADYLELYSAAIAQCTRTASLT